MRPNPFGYEYHDAHLSKMDQSEEVMQKIYDWLSKEKSIFYFCGNVGTGKTYFAASLWNYLEEKKQNLRAYRESEFFSEIKKVISQDWDYGCEIKRLCESKWLILDDMGTSQMTDWQKEVLFTLIDTRISNGLPTLITSNLSLQDVKEILGDRVFSRLRSIKNTIIQLDGEDRRQSTYE